MREHTRKHRTKSTFIENNIDEGAISANQVIREASEEKPMWAITLSGLRYREDMTQKSLGDLIGVKQGNISQMERGLRPIGKNIAKRLAKVFKVDYRRFL